MATSPGLLLDTSTFIWANAASVKLSRKASLALARPDAKLYVSLVSVWEMQIKHAMGKLSLVGTADETARRYLTVLEAEFLPIKLAHFAALYKLSPVHRDPFDRLLAAQAIEEGMSIVSPDRVFRQYPVPVIW